MKSYKLRQFLLMNKVYRFLMILIAVCLCGKWCYPFLFIITEDFLHLELIL